MYVFKYYIYRGKKARQKYLTNAKQMFIALIPRLLIIAP